MDNRMRNLDTLTDLEFDEQWTYAAKKQNRLTVTERAETSEVGEIYLWTCVDHRTKLMLAFFIGKRSADNARRLLKDVATRLVFPSTVPAIPTPSPPADSPSTRFATSARGAETFLLFPRR